MVDRHAAAVAATVAAKPDEAPFDSDLSRVFEALENGVRGYETASQETSDPIVTALLRELRRRREEIRADVVRVAAEELSAEPGGMRGTVPGAIHRGWIKLEGAVAGDQAIVESAITGEEEAIDDLEAALDQPLPEAVADAIRRAVDEVHHALDELRRVNAED